MAQRPAEDWSPGSQDELAALEAFTCGDLTALRFDDFLQSLAVRLAQLNGAAVGAIFLVDERGALTPRALQRVEEARVELSACMAPGFANRLVREQRPCTVPDVAAAGEPVDDPLRASGLGALLGAPLRVRGEVVGCVYVGLAQRRQFSARDLRRFSILADRAALSIDHVRLLEESQRHALELERVNQELREVDRLKSEFLSMVSHELRTPLTAIIGYTDLLLKQVHGSLNERQLQYQSSVRAGAQQLLALVNDLLDISRMEGEGLRLDRQPIQVSTLLQRGLDSVAAQARAKAIRLQLTTRPIGRPALADPERVYQVLHHLLSNALKFTDPGGQIALSAESLRGSEVLISVRDTGQGIQREQLDRIWDRFFQGDSSIRRVHGGTGLGLAIVRQIVELHGGKVWAESQGRGRGSTFSFTLPLVLTERAAAPAPVAPATPGRTLLLVEDDAANRDVVRTIAESLVGARVYEAEEGGEALGLAERLRPDLIVLDLMIPGLNGFEVARRLKQDPRLARIPILALSGLAHAEDREHALAAGADAYLAKPFRAEELADALRHLLSPAAAGSRG